MAKSWASPTANYLSTAFSSTRIDPCSVSKVDTKELF
jgi:hypothetical protein